MSSGLMTGILTKFDRSVKPNRVFAIASELHLDAIGGGLRKYPSAICIFYGEPPRCFRSQIAALAIRDAIGFSVENHLDLRGGAKVFLQ